MTSAGSRDKRERTLAALDRIALRAAVRAREATEIAEALRRARASLPKPPNERKRL